MAKYKTKLTKAQKQLLDYINSDEFRENDPQYKRLTEICQGRHLQFSEAWAIVEKEFAEKK